MGSRTFGTLTNARPGSTMVPANLSGRDVSGQQKYCASCKKVLDPQYLFCPECGSTLQAAPEPPETPQAHAPEPGPTTLEAAEKRPSPQPVSSVQTRPGAPVPPALGGFRVVRLPRGGGAPIPRDVPPQGLVVGRSGTDLAFPEDDTVSPRHARMTPEGDSLRVEDLGSTNGLFLRLKEPHPLVEGDVFVCGDTVFRISFAVARAPENEFRFFLAPTEKPPLATLTRILADGRDGEVFPVRTLPMLIGREEGHIRFASDRFMSRRHAQIEPGPSGPLLVDQKSRNGTYLRREGTLFLEGGDILLIGRQLLRVEALA